MESVHNNSNDSTKAKSEILEQHSELDNPVPDSENPGCNLNEALTSNHAAEKKLPSNNAYIMGRKIIFIFRGKLSLIKQHVEDQWSLFRHGSTDSDRITKVYQVWPGKNVFFFRGRLICGPDPRGLLLTILSIILSTWIFSLYGGNQFPNRPKLIISISIVLALTVLANLILVATSDPGIIPRNDEEDCEEVGTSKRNKRKAVITVNGVEVKLKYCKTCKIFRPPRSCHCVVCDNCVEKFDHHCPWIGQCIGLRNYRFYVTFICSALVFFIYLFAFSCLRIHRKVVKTGNIGFVWLAKNSPETLALTVFSFAAILFLSGLNFYHLYLIVINQTAYENFREQYVGSKNPYDKGTISNIKEVLFVPLPPSEVDFRAELTVR